MEEDGVGAGREAEGASVGGEGEETERRLRAYEGGSEAKQDALEASGTETR